MKNRRKFTRIILAPLDAPPIDEAFAVMEIDKKQIRRRIQNISYRGMGLVMEAGDDQRWLGQRDVPIGMEFEGVIARTLGEITFMGQGMIGVSFIALEDTSRRLVSAYIDPRFLAANVEEVSAKMLRLPRQRLFLGPNNTSLRLHYRHEDRATLIGAELVLLHGYLVSDEEGLKSGIFTGELMDMGSLKMENTLNPEMLKLCQRFLRHLNVDSELRLHLEIRFNR